jgi:hypothetical protein
MSKQTYIASGLSADERAIVTMPTVKLVHVISFVEKTGMPVSVSVVLGSQEPPSLDRNIVPRWPFQLGKTFVRPELVK